MPGTPHDPRSAVHDDDPSIVPGLGPSDGVPQPRTHLDVSQDPDRYDPARDTALVGPLDMTQDPDRYDPSRPLDLSRDPDRYDPSRDAAPVGRLDPARDPDRYRPPGQGQTLTDLLGEGAQEGTRDNYQWALGLLGVLAFLALVSFFFTAVVGA